MHFYGNSNVTNSQLVARRVRDAVCDAVRDARCVAAAAATAAAAAAVAWFV
jgi:23S rRNA G2445 N2-methylase RlmL